MLSTRYPNVRRIAGLGLAAALFMTGVQPGLAAGEAQPQFVPTSNATPGEASLTEALAFDDIAQSYAEPAINRLASLQLISGSGDRRFLPDEPITRQDFAVLFARVAGFQPSKPAVQPFADVAADSGYAPYVQALAAEGLLQGKSTDRFGAAEPLTRQELAVVLSRFLRKQGTAEGGQSGALPYQDADHIAVFAREAVAEVTAKGWMTGNGRTFAPASQVTRAAAAVVADRILAERVTQAEKVRFTVSHERIQLPPGGTEQIRVELTGVGRLPFTPIFSFDRPELGKVEPDGTFVAGPAAGTGQITVTVGYQTVVIPVEIVARDAEAGVQPGGSAIQTEGWTNYAPDSFFAVKTTGPADTYFQQLEKAYPGPVGGLIKPSETWTGYARQFGREITLSLPETKRIEQVSMNFRQDRKQGILLPTEMEVEVSGDGKAWYYAGKATHAVPLTEEAPQLRTLAVTLPELEIRHVRVRFPVQIFVFARQLQVWGAEGPATEANTILLPPIPKTASVIDRKAEDRMQNMLLAYSGAHGERGTWRKEDFLPMVGYVSPEGKVLDRMFDAVLFLPYPNLPATKKGWETYLDDLFQTSRQLDALNQAMVEYNRARGTLFIDPAVEKVVLTLPYPHPSQEKFGQLVKDQDSLSFSAKTVGEDRAYRYRKQALEWYFQELLRRWKEADYKYLKLEGIYWYHELIDDAVPRERELIRETAAMVHQQALRFYWIPYFGATGLGEWKQLGFDYAFIQPNYYNTNVIPIDRIETTLKVADQFGMGVEIEGDERMYRDLRFYQVYYNQLIAGHKLGIDKNKVHAYYFGSKTLLEAVRSKEPQARGIYDDTYKWMRGKFELDEYLLPPNPDPANQVPATKQETVPR